MNEMPSCFESATPMARKDHKCCECLGIIRSGEKYHRFSGVWDGEPDTYKVCLECETLRADVDAGIQSSEERTALGMLWESVLESGDEQFLARFTAIKTARRAADVGGKG